MHEWQLVREQTVIALQIVSMFASGWELISEWDESGKNRNKQTAVDGSWQNFIGTSDSHQVIGSPECD